MTRLKKRIVPELSTPLAESVGASPLEICECTGVRGAEEWVTSLDLVQGNLPYTIDIMHNLTSFLLTNPNQNSSNLFRADILFDSSGILKTPCEKELSFARCSDSHGAISATNPLPPAARGQPDVEPTPAREVRDFALTRTVVRRLIPRNLKLDRTLEQTCHFYEGVTENTSRDYSDDDPCELERLLVIYTPHISSQIDLPWYHPLLRSLALLYDFKKVESRLKEEATTKGSGTLSLHFSPFTSADSVNLIPTRLERTLQCLLATHVRLARGTRPSGERPEGGNYNPSKDNVIPQHLVQDTYSRLKLRYGPDLCRNWVEETAPSKHVFEDLAISAFLIELWRSMYGVIPATETEQGGMRWNTSRFPGFVDVACGNGVLVYVLLMEGYHGCGLDARQRKTWATFPEWVQDRLKESIYVPKPFADAVLDLKVGDSLSDIVGAESCAGAFSEGTFIISNHADELTVWTPLMATLASPACPLPFLAIPCCSHSLSGARYRYPPPSSKETVSSVVVNDGLPVHPSKPQVGGRSESSINYEEVEQDPQPTRGDLKRLRASKIAASLNNNPDTIVNSMYGCLTAKTVSVAEELGYEVEKTLLRIPSTRNMAIIGRRRRTLSMTVNTETKVNPTLPSSLSTSPVTLAATAEIENEIEEAEKKSDQLQKLAMGIIRRECAREGGIEAAAKIWIERAKGLHLGRQRVKTRKKMGK